MKALIVYGTKEGQTHNIANFIKAEAEKPGHEIILADAAQNPPSPKGFDVVIVGASLDAGKYHAPVIHYIKKNIEELNHTIGVFFSVNTSARGDDKESKKELEDAIADFLCDTGWKPAKIERIAGGLRYTKYDFLKKFMIKTDTGKKHEYIDWEKIKAFVDEVFNPKKEEFIFEHKQNLEPTG